ACFNKLTVVLRVSAQNEATTLICFPLISLTPKSNTLFGVVLGLYSRKRCFLPDRAICNVSSKDTLT
ncbi:hypothetical protein Bpfe_027183, partial [Biomphalaria pfeifferi]